MHDEALESTNTEVIINECREHLLGARIAETRVDELSEMLRTSLQKDNLLETIRESLKEDREVYGKHLDQEGIERKLRGYLFESIALESLPKEEKQFKELELFLLWSIKDPRIWYMDWETEGFPALSKEERKLLANYMRMRPKADELHALRNNDAISIDIKRDQSTNKVVAIITGVVEAKNHRLYGLSSDEEQLLNAPDVLYDVVVRYKKSFPLILKGLDLGPGMPDEIDILPPDQLSYTIIQPKDLDSDSERSNLPKSFRKCNFVYADVNWQEIALLAESVRNYI